MKTEILEEFVRLARSLNFRETASGLFISEAKLSRDIQTLESELGYVLFVRNRHRVALTQNGKKALAKAQDVLDAYTALLSTGESVPRSFSVSLVTRFPASSDLYLKARDSMRRKWPDVSFTERDCAPSDDPLASLAEGDGLAISVYLQNAPSNLEATALFDYRLCVWVSAENDVLPKDAVSPGDLSGMVYVHTARGYRDWDLYIQRLLRAKGVEFEVGEQVNGFFELRQNEFTIMVDVEPDGFFGRGVRKLAIEPPLTVPIAVFYNKNSTSPIAREFVATLERMARDMGSGK